MVILIWTDVVQTNMKLSTLGWQQNFLPTYMPSIASCTCSLCLLLSVLLVLLSSPKISRITTSLFTCTDASKLNHHKMILMLICRYTGYPVGHYHSKHRHIDIDFLMGLVPVILSCFLTWFMAVVGHEDAGKTSKFSSARYRLHHHWCLTLEKTPLSREIFS